MPSPDLQQVLEAIEKPLAYASGHDYSNLKTLKGLEPYMSRWLEKALHDSPEPEAAGSAETAETGDPGYDDADLEQKKTRILEAPTNSPTASRPMIRLPCPATVPTLAEFRQDRKDLQTPIQFIKGVGPRLSEILKKKNIQTVEDALYFLPRAYEDRRQIKKISQLTVGKIETVIGKVLSSDIVLSRPAPNFRGPGRRRNRNPHRQMVQLQPPVHEREVLAKGCA